MRITKRLAVILVALHAVSLAGGVTTGFLLSRDLPGIGNLDVLSLPQVTTLSDRDGQSLESFGTQRRRPVPLSQMSPWYLKAIIATEDPRFRSHFGVDPIAVARAVVNTVRSMDFGREGASTITMQLARDQFLHKRKTIWRKIQEAVLATQIEKHYSKDEILALYCNRIYLGHGRYGVDAAARYFFAKRAADLNLPEAALLAGLAQRPEALTPVRHPQRALARRNHVLNRMAIDGFIDRETADAAMKSEITIAKRRPDRPLAPHFVEEVRRWLLQTYGEEGLYEEGLRVTTTLDTELQRAAEHAVAHGLELYGRRHVEIPTGVDLEEGEDPETYHDPSWSAIPEVDDIVAGLVMEVSTDAATLRVGESSVEMSPEDIAWTRKKALDEILRVGALFPLRVTKVEDAGLVTSAELASSPSPDAALIALDVNTGEILALVGGKDFSRSEFDIAMQARRQAGSAFKPFIFASALEAGFLPTQRIPDLPTVIVDAGSPEPYQPENFERDYFGYVTLRFALEHSRNIPTLRMLDALSYDPAVEMAQRLGIATDLRAFPSLSLGSFEVKLVDLVAAYGAFANGGVLVKPQLVREVRHREQQLLYTGEPETREVLSPEVAAMMTSMLEGVVLRGTGQKAKVLRRPLAGKTGTTDDYTNAWFVGYTPSIALGVWVGYAESTQTLGRLETGARAALPIWIRFFEKGLGPPGPQSPPEEFLRPPGLSRALVDLQSGRRGGDPSCRELILEVFPQGREPIERCSEQDAIRSRLPYPLQRFPIDDEGRLMIPPEEAARLVENSEGKLQILMGGRGLRYDWRLNRKVTLNGSIALDWVKEDWRRYLAYAPIVLEERRLRELSRRAFLEELEEIEVPEGEDPPDPEKLMPPNLRNGTDGFPAYVMEANRSGRIREFEVPDDPS